MKHGNSQALIIDKAILDLLNINVDILLQMKVDGGALIVTPLTASIQHDAVEDALSRLRPRYKKMLENLA